MPSYYTPAYPPASPYPTTTTTATESPATINKATSSPPNGSTVLTISNPPPALATSGMQTPVDQSSASPTAASGPQTSTKRNQVKNACSKYKKNPWLREERVRELRKKYFFLKKVLFFSVFERIIRFDDDISN